MVAYLCICLLDGDDTTLPITLIMPLVVTAKLILVNFTLIINCNDDMLLVTLILILMCLCVYVCVHLCVHIHVCLRACSFVRTHTHPQS
jgi:hypothetical protein